MTVRYPLEVELVVEPIATVVSTKWKLWWRLAVAEGIDGAGPAGPSRLQFRDGGAVVWFDYAEPDRLLQVDVPFGVVSQAVEDGALLSHGHVDVADAEIIERLLGSEIRSRVENADEESFWTSVAFSDSWAAAGRAALIETMLDARLEPVAGFWAVELERILDSLKAGRSCELRRLEFASLGAPVVALLSASLASDVEEVPLVAHALRTFSHRNAVGGPLVDELSSRAASSVVDAAEAPLWSGAIERLSSNEGTIPDEDLAYRGAPPSSSLLDLPAFRGAGATESRAVCRRDFTVTDIVSSVAASVTEHELEVMIDLAVPSVPASQHLDVRATGPTGLLAAAVACEPLGDGRLRARLRLPFAVTPGDLTVVVGRGLPFTSFDNEDFDARQAVARGRDLVDAMRVGQSGGESAAADAWRSVGRPDLAIAVESLDPPPPLTTEIAAAALGVTIVRSLDGRVLTDVELPAARDLAWSLGHPGAAGLFEVQRRSLPAATLLPATIHDSLVLALVSEGNTDAATALDEGRPVPE